MDKINAVKHETLPQPPDSSGNADSKRPFWPNAMKAWQQAHRKAAPVNIESTVQLLTTNDLLSICRFSKSKLYLLTNSKSRYFDATFPKPRKIGLRSVRWNLSEVEAWIKSKPPVESGSTS